MGHGATNIGAFHESLNLAALCNVPVVFAIVNNGFGMGNAQRALRAGMTRHRKGGWPGRQWNVPAPSACRVYSN